MSLTTLQRVRSIWRPKSQGTAEDDVDGRPEVGFKVTHDAAKGELTVKVIAARNLPTCYGTVKPQGYLVKVKIYPGKEKHETEMQNNAWPNYNQDFKFSTGIHSVAQLSGKFVTLTVYAVLDQSERNSRLQKRGSFKEHIEAFIGLKREPSTKRTDLIRRASSRFSMNNRRTIGAVTYNLDSSVFSLDLRNRIKATPDIWRTIENISSGVLIESRESKKGSLEVTMSYSNSEDGKNDMVQVSLSKWRCSMQTMQDHEKLKGSLYIKMATFEYDVMVAKWKSDSFSPTISMKIEPKTATMSAIVNNYNMDKVKVVIKVKSKNSLAKKTELGQIEINSVDGIWMDITNSPTVPVTKMMDFQ